MIAAINIVSEEYTMATFTNQATLSFNGINYASNIITGELVNVLTVSKNAIKDTYTANDHITYVISILNSGTTAFTELSLSDNLGAYTFNTETLTPLTANVDTIAYYINGVAQSTTGLTITAGPPMNITGISVPAGGNALIVYETTANEYAPLISESTINNTVTIAGATLQATATADETVTILDEPVLRISKFLSPDTVTDNSPLTYTFLLQNTGNTGTVTTDNLILTDTFAPILSDITVTYNGTTWTEGTQYTYNATTGEFATLPGAISVPAATFVQDAATGVWAITPGTSTLTVTGIV